MVDVYEGVDIESTEPLKSCLLTTRFWALLLVHEQAKRMSSFQTISVRLVQPKEWTYSVLNRCAHDVANWNRSKISRRTRNSQ